MGTRINVLMDHDIVDLSDAPAILKRLEASLPAAHAVDRYWESVEPERFRSSPRDASDQRWTADPSGYPDQRFCRFDGPGLLFLSVNSTAARIRTGGRWRGLLSIPSLRQVHLRAFRSIAAALGATELIYFGDSDDVADVFWEGGTPADCQRILERDRGAPQPSVERIEPWIVEEVEKGVPLVWYREAVQPGGKPVPGIESIGEIP
jgi:hypothetical protein